MIFLSFYRLYISIGAGAGAYLFLWHRFVPALACIIGVRTLWFLIERFVERLLIENYFKKHIYEFKQQLGPYGIRMANKAEGDFSIKKSLAEVFVPDEKKLQKCYDQLKVLDTLYGAGMRPDPESWQLHDCKVKYASFRLEQEMKKKAT
jgi:hypothetical protein